MTAPSTGEPVQHDPDVALFDHRDAGTDEAEWAASATVTSADALTLNGFRRVVVIAAHPDDETLGAGGLIAEAAHLGIPVAVLVVSAGERSHPDSPTVSVQELAAVRRVEAERAIAVLDPKAVVRQLDVPDGGLTDAQGDITDELARLVGPSGLGTVLVAPWREDRHPDHAAAALAADHVARTTGAVLLEYPVWAWHWARPDDGTFDRQTVLALSLSDRARSTKEAALAQYPSQLLPLSDRPGDEAVVHDGFLQHFRRPVEIFLTATGSSLDQGFFDEFYGQRDDPWGFVDRWYEERKRAVTLACLPRRRFRSAFEPGCSIGVLTGELAARCDAVLAADISSAPLRHARRRLAAAGNVEFRQLTVPREWPPGRFDLVVLSEIGYYCSPADLSALAGSAAASLTDDGVLVACHWRHQVQEYPLTGDAVHAALRRESGLDLLVEHVEADFRLDVLVRPPARSVATAEGLVT